MRLNSCISKSAAICILLYSHSANGMYSTNGTFINLHSRLHHRHQHQYGPHRLNSLLALRDDDDNEEEMIKGSEDIEDDDNEVSSSSTGSNKIELIVSDFSSER